MRYLPILLLASCSWGPFAPKHPSKSIAELSRQELIDRASLYCSLSKQSYEDDKNILGGVHECDGTLFTSLHGLLCDYVSVDQFADAEGKLWRTPGRKCFAEGRSASEFSKDMATGFQLFSTVRRDRVTNQLLDQIIDYGEKTDWIVCEAKDLATSISRCKMSYKIISRWYDIAEKTFTGFGLAEDDDATVFTPVDFEAHLQVLGILVEWSLYGAISDFSKAMVKAQAEREPDNLLFQAVYARVFDSANFAEVGLKLLEFFPDNRLPNNHQDWCETYLFQRDKIKPGNQMVSPNWLSCPDEAFAVHPGTDFLTAAWVLLYEREPSL